MSTEAPTLCMVLSPRSPHGFIRPCVWNAGHTNRHTWQISDHDPNHVKRRHMNAVHDQLWQPPDGYGLAWDACNQCFRASEGVLLATIEWEGIHWHIHEFASPWYGRVDVRGLILAEGSWTAIEVPGSIPDNPDGETVQAFEGPFGGWLEIWERGDRIRYRIADGPMRFHAITGLPHADTFVNILKLLAGGVLPNGLDWQDGWDDLRAFPEW